MNARKTYLIVKSGGTPIDRDIDFVTGYLRHVLSFIGIDDVAVIVGDRLIANREETLVQAHQLIDRSVAALA